MNITIDHNSGFCFGVIHAIQTAEEYLQTHETLFCLGDIVHNNEEVKRLTQIGLRVINYEQFAQLRHTTVLIRAHGEPPATYELAKKNDITLIDATCPVVLKLQQRIRECHLATPTHERQILIFGKKGHAEVIGLMGQTGNDGIVISSLEEINRIDFSRPSMLYSQTTQSLDEYYRLIDLIQTRYAERGHSNSFEFADTICRKVANRAKEIAEFSKQHDTILFVSGEKSSNGLYLFDICKKHNPNSFMISNATQINTLNIKPIENIGICGATSTPMWLMKECALRVQNKYSKTLN